MSRTHRRAVLAALLLAALPSFAAALEPGEAAPPLAPKDVRGRALVVPEPGRVELLTFASRSSADAAGEIARAIRVEHPELQILSFVDLSGYPGFARRFVTAQVEQRQEKAVKMAEEAFARAGKQPPADLEARVHIVPDFEGESFGRYGARDAAKQPLFVVVGADGRIAAIFAKDGSRADVEAAVAKALAR